VHTGVTSIESQQQYASLDDARAVVAKMRSFAGQHGFDALIIVSSNDATHCGL